MTDPRTLVVIGAGLAGAKAAEGARSSGFDGRIVLVGDEREEPYERPPLSKQVLRGEAPPESARVHESGCHEAHRIELVTGRAVEALDVDARRVRLDDGEQLRFDAAVLATGSAPRRLGVPGNDLAGVHQLRSLDDARRLGEAIRGAERVGVIGAGWIGSEVAASARQMGAEVVLVDPLATPLQRVLGGEFGAMFAELHSHHGVKLRLGTGVVELRGTTRVESVVLDDGGVEHVDTVVVGIGVTPRVELARRAGLDVSDGIVTDEHLRTSAPSVYAAGDVASAWHPHFRRHLRVEHWANALNQGLTAGANAVGGSDVYDRLPYFFSDQYDLGLEYVGHHGPDDRLVVRGRPEARELVGFWHRDGDVTAAIAVNTWDVIDDLRSVVAARAPVDPDRLADATVPLVELVPPAR